MQSAVPDGLRTGNKDLEGRINASKVFAAAEVHLYNRKFGRKYRLSIGGKDVER